MAEDLQIRIPVTLGMENVPEEIKKIQQQLSNNKNINIKINAILSDDSINNIKNQLQSLFNNKQAINLNVNSNVQSQLSQVNQAVTTQVNEISKKAVVTPKVDISPIQQLENAIEQAKKKYLEFSGKDNIGRILAHDFDLVKEKLSGLPEYITIFQNAINGVSTEQGIQGLVKYFRNVKTEGLQVSDVVNNITNILRNQETSVSALIQKNKVLSDEEKQVIQWLQEYAKCRNKSFGFSKDSYTHTQITQIKAWLQDNIVYTDKWTASMQNAYEQLEQIINGMNMLYGNNQINGQAWLSYSSTLDLDKLGYSPEALKQIIKDSNEAEQTINKLSGVIRRVLGDVAYSQYNNGTFRATYEDLQKIIAYSPELTNVLQPYIDQLSNSKGKTKELKASIEQTIATLTKPINSQLVIQSEIDKTTQSIKNESTTVQEATSQIDNLGNTSEKAMSKVSSSSQKAEQEIAKVNSATKQTASNLIPIETQYVTIFNNVADVIKLAEKEFEKFGEITAVSNKPAFTESGLEYYKDFTIQVKSVTGEVQKFKYVMQQSEDGNIFYQLQNINEADAGIKKLIISQQKYNDQLKALRTSYVSDLKSIRSAWEDSNGGKSVKSDENVNSLKQQYINVARAIMELRNADETTMASMKANVVTQIDKLNQMVTQYHNAEKVATQLRAKGFETVKVDTGNNIDKFINSINNSKVPVQAMKTEIDNLTSSFSNLDNIEDQAGKSSALTNILNILDNAKTKFQALQELFKSSGNPNWLTINSDQINKIDDMATKTAIYKNYLSNIANEWKGQQLLVGNVAKEMASLQRGITSIKNPTVLDKYVARIQELVTNYQRLKINLDSQVESQNKIYQIQTQISKLSSTDVSNKAYLEQKLHDEEKTLQILQMQSGALKNIVSLEEQEAYVTQQVKKAREDATIAQNHQADTQMAKNIKQVSDYATAIEKSIVNLNRLKNSKIFADNSNKSSVQAQIAQIDQFVTKLTQMRETVGTMATVGNTTGKVGTTAFATLVNDMTNLNSQIKTAETSAKDLQTQLKQTNGVDVQKGKIKVLVAQLEAFAVANGKAMKSNKTLTSGMTVSQEWNAMMSKLKSGADNGDIQKITSQFKAMRSEVKALGLEGGTVFQKLWADAQKFARWMGLTMVTTSIAREIRGMFKTVAELDTELIDLRKTFKGTSKDLEDFYYSANDVAKQLGVTTKEVISQASSWSRLGFSTKEAATEMSKLSSMFASISPGMDVDTATTGLVSVMKAFKIDVDDVKEGIMSPINEIGNRFATDNNDIISGLSRSSAAMAAMNSTLSETIALFTAGQEVLQDSEKMGNALKSVAMRVRGYDESTEELSDDLVDITGKVIDLTKVASNDYKGVSLFTDETQEHYKSIYDYLVQIADVYDELSEKNQQELLEKLFGKYQAQAGAAILSNIQAAKDVMNVIENESAGSADREMEVIKDSVDYAKNELAETFTGIAQSSITRDFEKTILQSLTRVLDVLGDASSPLNGVLTTVSSIFEVVSKLVENLGLIPSIIAGISLSKSFKNGGLFRTVNADTDKFSQKIGILHRSFADIKADFSTLGKIGGGFTKQNFAHIFNFATKQDIANFQQFNHVIDDGQNTFRSYNTYMANAPTAMRQVAQEIVNIKNAQHDLTIARNQGKITQEEYNAQNNQYNARLVELRGNVNNLTLAQKALTIAQKVGATVATTAINVLISIAISKLISVVMEAFRAQEKLIEQNKQIADSYESAKERLEDYRQKYFDIIDSTNDEAEKDKQLIEWKKQLIEQYGLEEEALAGVNGERRAGIELLNEEAYKEAEKVISDLKDYENAYNKIYDSQAKTSLRGYNAMRGLEDYGLKFSSLSNHDGSFNISIDYGTSNAYEQFDKLSKVLSDLKAKSISLDENDPLYNQIHASLNNQIEVIQKEYDRVKKVIDDYGTTVTTGLAAFAQKKLYEFTDTTDGELANVIDKATFDAWKEKLLDLAKDDEPLRKSLETLANETFPNYSSSISDSSNGTKNAVTEVTSLNEALTKLQELLKDIISGSNTYQSAMQKITAGTGLAAKEVNELLELDPSLFDKFVKQKDGTWTIDLEALRLSYDTIIVDGGKDAIAEEKKSYQEQFNAVSKEIENLYVQRAEKLKHINGKADLDELNALDKQIEERKKALQGAQDDLNVASFQESLLNYSDADRIRDSLDEVTKQIDSYNDSISTLKKAQETLNEGNSLSYDDMTKLIMLYPQLKNSVIETSDGYTFEQSALESASKQAYQTRDDYIDSLISSAYAYKHAVETGLFKDYASVKDSIPAVEEFINILNGYKNNVKEPNSSSSKSADKSISDALQNQIDYYTTLLDAIEAVTDKQIDALEKEKNAIDSKIDALNDEKDALKGKNDEQQRELDLIEAQNNLEKAKKQKVFVYKEGEGLVQIQDEKAVKDAQKELDDVKREIKETDIDKQIEVYEKQQEAIDKQIDSANAYKDTFSDMESNAKDQLAIGQAKKALGVDENGLLHIDENTAKNIRNGLAEAIYNKDVNDNKDNDKYVTVSLADYLSGLGATVTPQQFQAIANTATGNTPITAPVTNSTVNNAQSIVNNKSITLNNTFNVYDSKDSNTVIEQIKSYMNKTLRTAINSIK